MAAAAVAWDETLRLEASCARCDDPELRRRWGCDREAPKPVMHLPCWHCDPERPKAGCEGCGGRGLIAWHRCPHRCGAEAAEAISQVHLVEAGITPWPVAFTELPDEVLTTFRLAVGRRGFYLRRDRKVREGGSALPPVADGADTSDLFRTDAQGKPLQRWPGVTRR